MMRDLRRVLAVLLCAALLACLAGCAGIGDLIRGRGSGGEEAAPGDTPPQSTSAAEERTTEAPDEAEAAAEPTETPNEEPEPEPETVKYDAYLASDTDVVVNGQWVFEEDQWGTGHYFVDFTSCLPGDKTVIIDAVVYDGSGAEIAEGTAWVMTVGEGQTALGDMGFPEGIHGADHADLTFYYRDAQEASGIGDVEMNSYCWGKGAAVEIVNHGDFVLNNPLVTMLLFDGNGAVTEMEDIFIFSGPDIEPRLDAGAREYATRRYLQVEEPYAGVRCYFSATRSEDTTRAVYASADEAAVIEQHIVLNSLFYTQTAQYSQYMFVLKNTSDRNLKIDYNYVIRDADTGEFLSCGGQTIYVTPVLLPGQEYYAFGQFDYIEGHPNLTGEVILSAVEPGPDEPVSLETNFAFEYTVSDRTVYGTFTNNDPSRTCSSYTFYMLGFDEAENLIFWDEAGSSQALAPGESKTVESLTKFPPEVARLEVFFRTREAS